MGLKQRLSAALRGFSDPTMVISYQSLQEVIDARVEDALFKGEHLAARTLPPPEGTVAPPNPGPTLEAKQKRQGNAWKRATPRWDRVREMTETALADGKVTGGHMLEIGGRRNPRNKDFPSFDYHALDLEDAPGADVDVMAGDITNCPHIPDESFDFIFSFDVFEHIDKPWLAASEIIRLLKPGGVTVHSTLFAWRYHPCPIDYWRYTAPGLASLFDGLDTLCSEFDYTERRRDIRGQGGNAVKPDAFGGWRENVRVHYAGQKPR